MKKLTFTTALFSITLIQNLYPQSNPRLENLNYVRTVFNEQFNSLSTTIWDIHHNVLRDNLFIWVPGAPTVSYSNGKLFLSMHYAPNYTTVDIYSGDSITANFIAGEVSTKKDFSYGIFECNATFAYNKGSFPAFWLYNDTMCFESERPEVDIVECKVNHSNPTLDNNIFYYPLNCLDQVSHEFDQHNFTWGGAHTFKCVWTPSKIEFWVDNTIKKQFLIQDNIGTQVYDNTLY